MTATAAASGLEVAALRKSFDGTVALDGVDVAWCCPMGFLTVAGVPYRLPVR
jgi:hypothetical protein